ncbi:MAG TPA: FG-GAP repeat protein, partial [bacterium]
VYVYERVGPGNVWSLMDTITGSDSVSGDQFGRSIGISGSAIIVGAYISGNGKAYVFRLHSATWVEEAILASTDATSGDNFGAQVAIGGNAAAVTARNHNGYGNDRGAVYFYRYSGGWSSGYKTIASAVEDFGEFGTSVRISGDNAVVSAFLECSSACAAGVLPAQGALYALRRDSGNTWRETKRITAPDAASNDRLGFGIGLSGNSVVAGAAFASPGGLSNAGKIYFFH